MNKAGVAQCRAELHILKQENAALEKQRDELVEALEGLLWAIHFNDDSAPHPMEEMEARAKQTLEKIKAQKG